MKNIFFGLALGIMAILTIGCASYSEHNYKMNAEVIYCDKDEVTIIDSTGNVWGFYSEGFNEYSKGDKVIVTFNDSCTNGERKDDEIIKIKFDK